MIINGHYVESAGRGIPVVFIHPPHMGHVVFKYQKRLSEFMNVIFYDIRGQGQSKKLHGRITIPLLADDIAGILDELEIEKAVICGYSLGGSIAQEFALRHPDRTLGILMSGGFSEVSTFLLDQQFKLGLLMTGRGQGKLLSKSLAKSHKVTKEDEKVLYDYAMLSDTGTTYDLYKVGRKYNATDRLSEITKPLWITYGARAFYFHPYMKIFKEKVPHMRPIFVSKAFHQVPIKFHQDFNHIMKQFIDMF